MEGYTYTSQQAKQVTITAREDAERVIIATAMDRQLSADELVRDKDLMSVAEYFSINLNDLSVELSTDPHDFAYTYSFKGGETMNEVNYDHLGAAGEASRIKYEGTHEEE